MERSEFAALVQPFALAAAGKDIDASLAEELDARFPADGDEWRALVAGVERGVAEGLLLKHEAGGIRYGRVLRPDASLGGFSVDVVEMRDVAGPHHRHPKGEIDLVMALDEGARFDGSAERFVVMAPDSAHRPTVSGGGAYVLYLLPDGEIDFG